MFDATSLLAVLALFLVAGWPTGGPFDPLSLASDGDEEKAFKLKTAEIKHGRLAMVAFFGFGVQALTTGEGALGSLAKFANNL
jgi:light-harvesting complex II chlorophyll a/b binding protein 4